MVHWVWCSETKDPQPRSQEHFSRSPLFVRMRKGDSKLLREEECGSLPRIAEPLTESRSEHAGVHRCGGSSDGTPDHQFHCIITFSRGNM
jgi:hypothetical protein